MPFVNSDPRSANNGNYSTSQQIAALHGFSAMGYLAAVKSAAERRAAQDAAKAAREAKQAQAKINRDAKQTAAVAKRATAQQDQKAKQAAAVAQRATAQAAQKAKQVAAQTTRAGQQAAKKEAQVAAVAARKAQQAQTVEARKAQQVATQAARVTKQAEQKQKQAAVKAQRVVKQAEQKQKQVAVRAQRVEKQAAAKAARVGITCVAGETAKKCHGTPMCLKAGEKCGGGKGTPKKVSPQQDQAAKANLEAQAKDSCVKIKQSFDALLRKNPARAAAFYARKSAQLSKCGVSAPPASAMAAVKPAQRRAAPVKRLKGFSGLSGFGAMGSLGVCADGYPADASGMCSDGTMDTAAAGGSSISSSMAQMMNTEPPKGCDKRPNKPVCQFYQMSTQMQTFMFAMLQMIEQNQQIMMELIQELQMGGTGGEIGACAAGQIMDINGNCIDTGTTGDVCAAAGMATDPYTGQCISPQPYVDPYAQQQQPYYDPYAQQQQQSYMDPYAQYGGGVSVEALPGMDTTGFETTIPQDIYAGVSAQQYMPAQQYGGPSVEALPGMEASGMEMMIPEEVRPSEMYPGYAPQMTTPEAIPAGFDVGEGDIFGAGAGTQIPTEMPISQSPGMPMYVPAAPAAAAIPTTESYSAADLVNAGVSEEFMPTADYYPETMQMPQMPQGYAPSPAFYPVPQEQAAYAQLPVAPQGYLPQQYGYAPMAPQQVFQQAPVYSPGEQEPWFEQEVAYQPEPSVELLPFGRPRGYAPPVEAIQPDIPQGVMPVQPSEVVQPEQMSPELIAMTPGGIYSATSPIMDQGDIVAAASERQWPLEVTD